MSTRPISGIPQIPVPSQFAQVESEWLKTAGKVGLAASVVIASIVAFTKLTVLPALLVSGGAALAGFALYSCFQRCFSGQNRGDGADPDPAPFRMPNFFRGRREERAEPRVRGRHPRDRVRGDDREVRSARGFGDFMHDMGNIFRRGNLSAGRGTVGVGTGEITRPSRRSDDHIHVGERSSGGRTTERGNLGGTVRLGGGGLTSRHEPGRTGRGQPMRGLPPVSGRTPAPAQGSQVGGRTPAQAPTPVPVPGRTTVQVGGGQRLAPTPPVPPVHGETHVRLGTGALTPTPPAAGTSVPLGRKSGR